MRIWMVAGLLALTGAANAGEQWLQAGADGAVAFVMPSGNINCYYVPDGGSGAYRSKRGRAELLCERAQPSYVALHLGASGKAVRVDNPGDLGRRARAQVLEYGNSWSAGPFTCLSARNGLTCTSSDGHGFFVSKARITVH